MTLISNAAIKVWACYTCYAYALTLKVSQPVLIACLAGPIVDGLYVEHRIKNGRHTRLLFLEIVFS